MAVPKPGKLGTLGPEGTGRGSECLGDAERPGTEPGCPGPGDNTGRGARGNRVRVAPPEQEGDRLLWPELLVKGTVVCERACMC